MSPFPRQTPLGGEVYLDHVGWFVPDMAEATSAFEHLGFSLTPFVAQRNADPAGCAPQLTGTGNRCAMLRRGYLEILAAIEGEDTQLARQHRAALGRYVGVHLIAFAVADVVTAYTRLRVEGFEPLEPTHLRRPLPDSEGREEELRFTVLRVPPDKMKEGRIQMVAHETPELVWQPERISRGNGISVLAGVLLCVDEPLEAAQRYGRFLGRRPTGGPEYAVIGLDRGRLGFATREHCGRLLPGLRVARPPVIAAIALVTHNVAAPRRFCAERRIPVLFAEQNRFCIDPGSAMGTALLVHGPSDLWPPQAT